MVTKDAITDKILNAGLKIMNQYGFGGLSLSELARASKISKQRLYYHFPTPEDVLIVLAEQWSLTGRSCTVEALAATREVGAYKILAICEGTFRWMEAYSDLSRLGLVLYQSSPHIKRLNHFLGDARKIARTRVKDLLVQEKVFQKMSTSELEKAITAIHSLLYGFFFYIITMNDFENLKVHEKNCHENMRRLIDSYLK